MKKNSLIILLFLYSLLLVWLLWIYQRSSGEALVNLVPFHSIQRWLHLARQHDYQQGTLMYLLQNLIGNILLFVPLGWLLAQLIHQWSRIRLLLLIVACSLIIEVGQYIFRIGMLDIDDVLLNMLGGLLGVYLPRVNVNRKR